MKRLFTLFASGMLTVLVLLTPAGATVIDFEAQAGSAGSNLTGIANSPLTIGIATFTGGELLKAEVGLPADQTGIYASQGLFGSGETNPLVINFATPVDDFSVLVANGDDARSYTLADNLGDSVTMSLPSAGALGAATFSLSGKGLNTVYITSANADAWDFAIDNVTFTTAAPTPEPNSLLLVGAPAIALMVARRKQLADLLSNRFF